MKKIFQILKIFQLILILVCNKTDNDVKKSNYSNKHL